jgi:hypothetical protein
MEAPAWRRHRAIGYVAIADRQAGLTFRMKRQSAALSSQQSAPLARKASLSPDRKTITIALCEGLVFLNDRRQEPV